MQLTIISIQPSSQAREVEACLREIFITAREAEQIKLTDVVKANGQMYYIHRAVWTEVSSSASGYSLSLCPMPKEQERYYGD